jgi:hypothetical protein
MSGTLYEITIGHPSAFRELHRERNYAVFVKTQWSPPPGPLRDRQVSEDRKGLSTGRRYLAFQLGG